MEAVEQRERGELIEKARITRTRLAFKKLIGVKICSTVTVRFIFLKSHLY